MEAVSSARGRPRGEGWERCEANRAFIKGKLDQRIRGMAQAWAVGRAEPDEIDRLNILRW